MKITEETIDDTTLVKGGGGFPVWRKAEIFYFLRRKSEFKYLKLPKTSRKSGNRHTGNPPGYENETISSKTVIVNVYNSGRLNILLEK